MRHTIRRDGIVAGLLGATAVAVWFFVGDLIRQQPFRTPIGLGRGLLSVLGPGKDDSAVVLVIGYTIFHYLAFIAVGLFAAMIVHLAEREPSVLAGALILFVATEIGFYALSAVLAESPFFGTLSWIQVSLGNLIAAVVMGTYLWRTHPELKRELDFSLGGSEGP
jgi:hypothetical protein